MTKILAAALIATGLLIGRAAPARAVGQYERLNLSTMTVTGPGVGSKPIVPAQGAGIRIALAQYEISCTTNTNSGTTVAWTQTDNKPANILTSTHTILTSTIIESPYIPNGWLVVPANKNLMLNIGTSDTCAVNAAWFTIQQ